MGGGGVPTSDGGTYPGQGRVPTKVRYPLPPHSQDQSRHPHQLEGRYPHPSISWKVGTPSLLAGFNLLPPPPHQLEDRFPPPPVDRHVSKHYLPHPSDARGGNFASSDRVIILAYENTQDCNSILIWFRT